MMEPSRRSRAVTIATVLMLAGIAAVVSYSHMYDLALRHGEPAWRASLFPLSVDGMIVGASMTLLSDARRGSKGGVLPWALLIIGSAASLAANVAVADPTVWSRIIHAWPSFALIGAYELLMREFRSSAQCVRTAFADDEQDLTGTYGPADSAAREDERFAGLRAVEDADRTRTTRAEPLTPFQDQAWRWAVDQEREVGVLPTGAQIAECFGRKERWGRLVKERGLRQRKGAAEHEADALAEHC